MSMSPKWDGGQMIQSKMLTQSTLK